MPKLKLTDAAIKNLKAPVSGQIDYFDKLLPSFGVRVSAKGLKTFFVFDRVGGKLKRMALGRYVPGDGDNGFGLAAARDKARLFKTSAERGADPVVEAKVEAAATKANTFGAAVEAFLTSKSTLAAGTLREYRNCLTGQDLTEWKDRQLASISRADVKVVLDAIDKRGKPAACNHMRVHLGVFFNWCADPDRGALLDSAPTDRMRARHANTKRDRVLSDAELAIVVAVLRDDDETLRIMFGINDVPPLSVTLRDYFLTLALTGQRRAEVGGMSWGELSDLDGKAPVWELPGSRTKNGLPHLVPLALAVVAILKRRKAAAEAEKQKVKELAKSDDGAALAALNVDAVFPGVLHNTGRAKAALDDRAAALCKALGRPALAHWTIHDFRRTMVTGMGEEPLSVLPHVVEAVVNHVSGVAKAGVAGTYNRARYMPERRAALAAWAEHVEALEPARAS